MSWHQLFSFISLYVAKQHCDKRSLHSLWIRGTFEVFLLSMIAYLHLHWGKRHLFSVNRHSSPPLQFKRMTVLLKSPKEKFLGQNSGSGSTRCKRTVCFPQSQLFFVTWSSVTYSAMFSHRFSLVDIKRNHKGTQLKENNVDMRRLK